jgi:arylsulfatase A-like enzyme/Tfp pilus assembly protein PilF
MAASEPRSGRSALAIALAVTAVVGAAVLIWRSWGEWRGAPNVLVISIDTLRADRVGSYGYKGAQTPNLDALAARGVRFADAATVTPLTLPAHASLLTGTFPAFHGIRDNGGFYLPDDHVTVAELLHGAGYRTGAFVGAFVLDSRWGLAQGFETYFDDFDLSQANETGMDSVQRRGDEVIDRTIAWLNQDTDRPFFAWAHLYDPHAPYAAPEPFGSRFPRTLQGVYDAEVAWTDRQVGRLLSALESADRLDDTIVVVVGDHGESLGEHQEQQHGFFIYDAALRIPFIIAGPGFPARVVADQVRIVDVLPTIVDRLGMPVPDRVQGKSLLGLVAGERLQLLALGETWYPRYHYGWSELVAVRDGRFKFILAPARELYDVQADPGETSNLAASQPDRADALERSLRAMVADVTGAAAQAGPRPVDPDVEQRLRALGYLSGSVSAKRLAQAPRGDPKDKIGLYNLLKLAGQDSVDRRLDAAIEKVQRVLAADDQVVEAHTMLGNLHSKAGRFGDAVKAFRQALAIDPEYAQAAFNLSLAYAALGRDDDARAGFERVLALDPRNGKARFELADAAMKRGDFDGAAATLTEGLALDVDRAPFLVKLAECYIELKRFDAAEAHLREAIEADAQIERAHYDLGLVHEARGATAKAIEAYEAELRVNPASYSASFNLGRLLAGMRKPAEAQVRFRQAVEANPQFGAGYLYLAKALLDTDDLPAAEAAALKGLRTNDDRSIAPLGHYVLADVYNRMGRLRDAERHARLGRSLEQQ